MSSSGRTAPSKANARELRRWEPRPLMGVFRPALAAGATFLPGKEIGLLPHEGRVGEAGEGSVPNNGTLRRLITRDDC